MQTKTFFKAVKAFAVVALGSLLMTSCYKSDGGDVPDFPEPTYVVCGNLFSASTGEPVNAQVAIQGGNFATSVSTVNGFYTVTVKDPGTYTVNVDLDGYAAATRTVVVPKVGFGETGIGRADIMLFSVEALITTKVVNVENATPLELQDAVFDTIDDIVDDLPAVSSATLMLSEVETTADGTIKVHLEYDFDEATAESLVPVEYPLFSGFATDVKPSDTKAITAGEMWLAVASQKFNMPFGLTVSLDKNVLEGISDYSMVGFTADYVFVGKKLEVEDCDGDGNKKSGIVAYMESVVLSPAMESHSHSHSHGHSHGHGHGDDLGAGGGASLPF